jgi:hopanoid biosynthesis associated RND transporter like protein HpnN
MDTGKNKYRGMFGLIVRHPRFIIAMALTLSLVSLIYTWQRMEFLTARDDLMPKNTTFNRDYRDWREEFGDMEEIVVVIESDDQERASRFGEQLFARLSADKRHIRDLFYPNGLPFFKKNGLLFMPLSELQDLRRNLGMAVPVLKDLAASPSVQTLFTHLTGRMNDYVRRGKDQPGGAEELVSLVFMLDKLGLGFKKFGEGGTSSFSLEEFFLRGSDGKESQLSRAGKMQIMTLLPVKDTTSFVPAEATIAVVRAEVAALRKLPEFNGVTVGLTGTPVLEHEEMATSQRDIALATVISLILTVILLLIAFRGVLNVLAAMVTIVVAICLSFGFATLVVGHLNILSMVFAIMLIGIGIEYGIQLVLRYQEELAGGATHLDAIAAGLNRNVWAILMAAAAVAAAFLTFIFTDFKGIAELGIIAGGGVIFCVMATFTVLPAMLILLVKYRKPGTRDSGLGTLSPRIPNPGSRIPILTKQLLFGHPKVVIVLTVLLCAGSIFPLVRMRFDYNLMNLQAKGLESVTYAYKLMKSAENSGYFAVVTARTRGEAQTMAKQLEALPTVDHVVSYDSFIPEDQPRKLALLADLRRELDSVRPGKYEEDLRVMELPTVFENFRNSVDRLKTHLVQEKKPEAKQVGAFLAILDAFFKKLEKDKDTNALGMLRDFQGGMMASLPEKIAFLKESLNPVLVTEADIPTELTKRFVGKSGRYLLQVAPKHEIFDLGPLKAFIDDVRTVDRSATGEPVMVYESMTIMRDAYSRAFVYAFIAIIVILLITFRSITYAAVGLVPLVVGVLLMVGGMWLCGISFNSANIIVMPLVLGIAVDSGIYLINRYRREGCTAVEVVTSSTGVGVFLNTLTIMASFGALMVAHHRGVFSIGIVMSLGMVACQVAFVIVLPAVLTLVGKRLR